MIEPVEVKPKEDYWIWVRYSDGTSGEVDLSHLVGMGVFQKWESPGFFETVRVAAHRAVAWGDDIDICSDALYMEITGLSVDEALPRLYAHRLTEETHLESRIPKPLVRVNSTPQTWDGAIFDDGDMVA